MSTILIVQILINVGSIFVLGGGLIAITVFPDQRKAMNEAKLLVAIGFFMILIAIAIYIGLPDLISNFLGSTFGFN